jgi:hypothetical protein
MAMLATACKKPMAAIAQMPQKSQALTSIMVVPPGSHSAVITAKRSCNSACPPGGLYAPDCGHPECLDFRPRPSQESAPRPLRAPRAVKAGGATRRGRNRLEWLQIALHLEDTRGRI